MKKVLREHIKKYNENYNTLVSTMDWSHKRRKKYIKLERKLDTEGINIRRKLGIYAYDPCPDFYKAIDCSKCYRSDCIIKREGVLWIKL